MNDHMESTQVIVFSATSRRVGRDAAAGRARQLVRGVYTYDLTTPPERLVRQHAWRIVSHLIPDALIVDRSAGPTLFAGDVLFVASQRRSRNIELPGLTVSVRSGTPLPDDPLWAEGLRKSSTARALVDNLAPSRSRSGIARTLSTSELADWVAILAQQLPNRRFNALRDRSREVAEVLDHHGRYDALDKLFAQALGTSATPAPTVLLRAQGEGRGWDRRRIANLQRLAEDLADMGAAGALPDISAGSSTRTSMMPFFEAYFSNFIEGTEFTVDEAIDIVYRHREFPGRHADSHDVTATYELLRTSATVPANATEFVSWLKESHASLMAARPDKRPGQFKLMANQAGGYRFVSPELVLGTIERGYPIIDSLRHPFARAVFTMFLVSEVHPFDDGNGRLARLAANVELAAGGQQRYLIPIVARIDYLNGLRRLSREAEPGLLVRVLRDVQQWSAQVDFSTLESVSIWLTRTNAMVDPVSAEQTGVRLLLPMDLETLPPDPGVADTRE